MFTQVVYGVRECQAPLVLCLEPRSLQSLCANLCKVSVQKMHGGIECKVRWSDCGTAGVFSGNL